MIATVQHNPHTGQIGWLLGLGFFKLAQNNHVEVVVAAMVRSSAPSPSMSRTRYLG